MSLILKISEAKNALADMRAHIATQGPSYVTGAYQEVVRMQEILGSMVGESERICGKTDIEWMKKKLELWICKAKKKENVARSKLILTVLNRLEV